MRLKRRESLIWVNHGLIVGEIKHFVAFSGVSESLFSSGWWRGRGDEEKTTFCWSDFRIVLFSRDGDLQCRAAPPGDFFRHSLVSITTWNSWGFWCHVLDAVRIHPLCKTFAAFLQQRWISGAVNCTVLSDKELNYFVSSHKNKRTISKMTKNKTRKQAKVFKYLAT